MEIKQKGNILMNDKKLQSSTQVNQNNKHFEKLECLLLKKKYIIKGHSKSGGFGEVFIGKHIDKDYEVAVKFSDSENEETKRQYSCEKEVLKVLKKLTNNKGFPRMLNSGFCEEKKMNFLVMTKYDADLESIFTQSRRKFKLQTVLTIGVFLLDILERFHSLGYVHIDLKPQNIMMKKEKNQIYLIDFGLTQEIQYRKKIKFRGTPFFASNNSIQKIGYGPKDDLESLMYILIYFILGNLPWSKYVPVMKEDVLSTIAIQNVISQRNPYTLCRDLEPEFPQILEYLQELSSSEKPNYKQIRKEFEQIIDRHKLELKLEWMETVAPPLTVNNYSSQSDLTPKMVSKQVSSNLRDEVEEEKSIQLKMREIIEEDEEDEKQKSEKVKQKDKCLPEQIKTSTSKCKQSYKKQKTMLDGIADEEAGLPTDGLHSYSIPVKENHLKKKI